MLRFSIWLLLVGCTSHANTDAGTCNASEFTEPDLRFDGVREISPASIALSDYFDPCATQTRLLVLRIGAGWCGTCRWQAEHTNDLFDAKFAGRLELVDVVLANDDNAPASVGDLASYREWIVRNGPRTIVADPKHTVAKFLPERVTLPALVLLDRKTMRVVDVVTETDIGAVNTHIAAALGVTASFPTALEDGRFAKYEVEMTRAMLLPGAPLPDPSNAKADDVYAAGLGEALFSDTGFSQNGMIACATCHKASKAYSDGLPTSMGVAQVDRNAPSITLAGHSRWLFWDGRADSLWSQALGPMEAASEMGSTRLRIAHHISDNYKKEYEAVFGSLPPLSDTSRFPADGKPMDPSWESMAPADKDAVNRVFANAGKSIEAHERQLRAQPSALDRYILGDKGALTDAQKDGLHAFFVVGCAQCHYGPRLTDDAFHALRFATGRVDGMPDRGRIDAIAKLDASEFSRNGSYSDAKGRAPLSMDPSMLGAFKTPTLRALPSTAPYGHGGTFASLDEIIAIYARGGDPNEPKSIGAMEPWIVKFDEQKSAALVEMMKMLTGEAQN